MRFNSVVPLHRKLFLIDAIGALVSAVMLGVVLAHWQPLIGLSTQTLYFLAALPCLFMIHSYYRYLTAIDTWRKPLQIVAIANLLYCALTSGLMIYHKNILTELGILYFMMEIIIVMTLSILQLKTSQRYNILKP